MLLRTIENFGKFSLTFGQLDADRRVDRNSHMTDIRMSNEHSLSIGQILSSTRWRFRCCCCCRQWSIVIMMWQVLVKVVLDELCGWCWWGECYGMRDWGSGLANDNKIGIQQSDRTSQLNNSTTRFVSQSFKFAHQQITIGNSAHCARQTILLWHNIDSIINAARTELLKSKYCLPIRFVRFQIHSDMLVIADCVAH